MAKSNERDYVLCVNSYNFATPWSNRIVQTLSKRIQAEPNLMLHVEHMRSLLINDEETYNKYTTDLLKKYANKKPRIIFLIGNPSLSLRDAIKDQWGDVPIILYASLDYTSKENYYVQEKVIPIKERIPLHELQDKYNLTLLQSDFFVSENIKNITQQYPELKSILFLRDSRHISFELEDNIRRVLSEQHPEIRLDVLTPDMVDMNDLVDRLNSIDTRKTAVLYSSWCYVSNLGNLPSTVANTRLLIATANIPIFTISFADLINEGGVMYSGVTYDTKAFYEQLSTTFDAVLAGTQPRDIPFYAPKTAHTYVNYDAAKAKNVDLSHLNDDVIILHPPKTFLEEHAGLLILSLIGIFAIGAVLYRFKLLRIENTVIQKESDLNEKLKTMAEEANRLKSAFLANMSHEIRTPLNAIVGFSELLSETEDEEEKKEFVEVIKMNNEMLLRLIGDVLDLSKLEAGMAMIKPIDMELVEMMENSFSFWARRFAEKDIIFEMQMPSKECHVCLDEKAVLQVLTNFLSNAFKYTVSGKVTLKLDVVNKGVTFSVKDTGIGIPERKQELVFGRFAKLDEFAQGTGLGLSICKTLTEFCGGEIGFSSKKNEGSTFWAHFPTKVSTKGDKKEEATVEEEQTEQKKQFQRRIRILIAEDNDSNYKLEEAILKKDFDLIRAKNGKEAIKLFTTEAYDIILMDMRMPIMDGMTAVKKIREFDKHVPIIAITADAFDTDRLAAIDAGCNSFHSKPLNRDRVLKDIERLVVTLNPLEIHT